MKPKNVNEYIEGFPEPQKTKLIEMREIIRDTLPGTTEALKWGPPAILDPDGMILVIFSGHKQHMNLVGTPTTKKAFEDKLVEYETGKGSVKFYYDKPLPAELIKSFVAYRAKEYREQKVLWR